MCRSELSSGTDNTLALEFLIEFALPEYWKRRLVLVNGGLRLYPREEGGYEYISIYWPASNAGWCLRLVYHDDITFTKIVALGATHHYPPLTQENLDISLERIRERWETSS